MRRARPRVRTHIVLGPYLLGVCLLGLQACGEGPAPLPAPDEPLAPLVSAPAGEAVDVAWRGVVGERYTASFSAEQTLEQRPADGPATEATRRATWQLVEETVDVDGRDRPLRARMEITYAEGGPDADAEPAIALIDRSSRRHPHVMWTQGGGTPVASAAGRLDAAGLGGSPPWIPTPAVQVGQAWTLQEVTGAGPEAPPGWQEPEEGPWTEGRFLVTAIEGRGADAVVVVQMTTRTRLLRPAPAEDGGPLQMTEDVTGTAHIAAATGRPLSLELETTKRTTQGEHEVLEHGRLEGVIVRTPPGEAR